jgi:uncharacterized protein YndB with AHSA1/START domain
LVPSLDRIRPDHHRYRDQSDHPVEQASRRRPCAADPKKVAEHCRDAGRSLVFQGNSMNPKMNDRMETNMAKEKRSKPAAGATNTVRLHRVFATSPEKVYRAFLDRDAMAKWLPPHGFTCNVDHSDAKVGGRYKMSFTNFTTGKSHSFGGEYLELVPHERLRYTDTFDDPNLPGEIEVTVTLKQVSVGTEVHIEQKGLPSVIPVEACYLGWQQSLNQLATLIEPNITD